ncbi:PREDICTED: F-box/FBD/LRR-repeat protein At2g26030-like [Erythranthe guttata]|uniref:F-box/FBD/LRR-repeat protein At2g26030-like n=1 Tax=Erythranthe guttata TaxID=4155 RepID=UPI00064D8865|nr:PREDICTED: F-box/FBD/LRR-repeat protein At2g26030-like [Erythranthe guttata]|eukprot:XP_012848319.1 PREDICTED: F-box/FBD/LRR-repeat protein At2g26030-like [Erythranthe guttata]
MDMLHNHSHGERNTFSIDRLSDLPDSVLTHILSFLQTKDSVRTSVLARRWRYLWAYVPTLDFDGENKDFINKAMLLHIVERVNTFRLLLDKDYSFHDYPLDTWTAFAIMRRVQNLDLCLRFQVALPRRLFTCKTLVHLSLTSCGAIPKSGAVCLPSLKKLHLIRVRYEADESLPYLISSCPVLEELLIESIMHLVSCIISSPTIKWLTVQFQFNRYRSYSHDYRLEINTPALIYLNIVDGLSEHIESGPLSSLTEAYVQVHNDQEKQDDFLYSRSVLEFIDRLRHIKCLKLDLFTDIVDSAFSTSAVSFRNLTKLTLFADCRFLSKFLQSAHNLEIVFYFEAQKRIKRWMEPQQAPGYLLSRLRTIQLFTIQREIVRYLLRNATVLEKMVVVYHCALNFEERKYFLHEISAFERRSEVCELAFVNLLDWDFDGMRRTKRPDGTQRSAKMHLKTITLIDIVGTKHELEIARYVLRRNAEVL